MRKSSSVTFTWNEGDFNGGAEVIDYRVSFDQSTGTWTDLDSGILQNLYTATGLTSGKYYNFRVEARNIQGYSLYSDTK